ncbi:MAG: hypothetical protein JHC74_07095 [Thermoleophilia bacterium]|nr:hypothetical protein [Thermoleophilia bacterium]
MRARAAAAAAAALVLLAGAAAGCGGSSETVTRTVTTDRLPGTTTAPAAPATAPATSPTAPSGPGEGSLPPPDALAGLRNGVARPLGDAQSFVDALYQAGDPVKPSAVARLSASGYAGGILRDQVGQDPARGIALFRTYALALRDDAAASAEVGAAVEEVRASTSQPTRDLDLSDLPGAQGLHVDIQQGTLTGAVVFVTFASGPVVYGLQGVSTNTATLPEDEIVGAARDLYERVTAAP